MRKVRVQIEMDGYSDYLDATIRADESVAIELVRVVTEVLKNAAQQQPNTEKEA